jgi:2-octaprenyl-6-methoxyphenol hydroxylase
VAIGNAAQALHPVAGQGLNLGLRDAAVLARQLGDASCDARSLAQALAGFAQSRHADRELLVASTDLLASLTRPELLKPAHSAALALIDLCAPLRQQIARGLMFGVRNR